MSLGRKQFHSVGDGAIRRLSDYNNRRHKRTWNEGGVLSTLLDSNDSSYYSYEDDNLSQNSLKDGDYDDEVHEENDDVFDDNNSVPEQSHTLRNPRKNVRHYRKRQVKSTSHLSNRSKSSTNSAVPRHTKRIIAKNSIKGHRKKKLTGNLNNSFEVIKEDQEESVEYARSKSNPALLNHHKNRLQRRRSAVTFHSTYRTLSTPSRLSLTPTLSSISSTTTSSITSSMDVSCLSKHSFAHSLLRHKYGSWSLWNSCLAHRQQHGSRMSPMEVAIRKSLE